MPMATRINPVKVSQTGVSTSSVAADLIEGNVVANLSGLQLTVDNSAGAGAVTVTFETTATVEGQSVADLTATVPVAGIKRFGRFSRALFGDQVGFTCSAACELTATY